VLPRSHSSIIVSFRHVVNDILRGAEHTRGSFGALLGWQQPRSAEQVPAHLLQQNGWSLVQVAHEVLKQMHESRGQQQLTLAQSAHSLGKNFATFDERRSYLQQHRLLLQQAQVVEEEKQQLRVLYVEVLVFSIYGLGGAADAVHQRGNQAAPDSQYQSFLLRLLLHDNELGQHC
jgi:hypothetical protein